MTLRIFLQGDLRTGEKLIMAFLTVCEERGISPRSDWQYSDTKRCLLLTVVAHEEEAMQEAIARKRLRLNRVEQTGNNRSMFYSGVEQSSDDTTIRLWDITIINRDKHLIYRGTEHAVMKQVWDDYYYDDWHMAPRRRLARTTEIIDL